jgi:hypothetical protein
VEYEMLDLIALVPSVIFLNYKERVEEICVVFFVVDGPVICVVVTPAQCCQAIAMVRVPVAQVLNLRVSFFNLSEDIFLIIAVLKKTYGGALRLRARPYHSMQMDFIVLPGFAISAYQAPASFVRVIEVALVEYGLKSAFGDDDLMRCVV